jgi:hypothetical protein
MADSISEMTYEQHLVSLQLVRHIDGDHPVPAYWAEWIIAEFVEAAPEGRKTPAYSDRPFRTLDPEGKIARIERRVVEGYVPAFWLCWLIDTFVPGLGASGSNRILH